MAIVRVEVPDGEYCGSCGYLMSGTILCTLFDELCTEDPEEERYVKMIKHERCPRGEE